MLLSDECEPWARIATENEYVLVIYTISAAHRAGFALHRDAALLGHVIPDVGPATPISFPSVTSVKTFINSAAPRSIEYRAAPGESLELVRALLEDGPHNTLH